MLNKRFILTILIAGVVLTGGVGIWFHQHRSQNQQLKPVPTPTANLKQACLNATIKGISLDIKRLQKWLELPSNELSEGAEPKAEIETKLNQLKADLERYENLKPENYNLPEKREVVGWIDQPCTENTILQTEDVTRSGPFYHIVGIKGGDCSVLTPQTKYQMIIYLVYPRHYPFPDSYIYISSYQPI